MRKGGLEDCTEMTVAKRAEELKGVVGLCAWLGSLFQVMGTAGSSMPRKGGVCYPGKRGQQWAGGKYILRREQGEGVSGKQWGRAACAGQFRSRSEL